MELKTYFIRTYGCQMNELDSEILSSQLEKRGMIAAKEEKSADLLLFNTCSIRDLAERKVMGKLGLLSRRNKKQIIGVCGCMVMAKREEFFKKFPHVHFLLGTNNLSDLNPTLDRLLLKKNQQISFINSKNDETTHELIAKRKDPLKAYVSIIRGCNNFCTYCIVPYTRGREVSRSLESIITECKELADKGYKEICLLGQNVNSYGKDRPDWKTNFSDLLYKIDQIEGIDRVRFMTSHPLDISKDLMYAIRDLKSVCEFVHFPLQAGSNRILKKMNRGYTKELYFEKVSLLRSIVPNVSLGTDIIVGFPTETEEEFLETKKAFAELGYSTAFIFAYSPRKNTPAYKYKDDVTKEIKQQRLQELLKIYQKISQEEHEKLFQTSMEVFVEKQTKDPKFLSGRTRCWKKVVFQGKKEMIGTSQKVKIEKYHSQTLIGSII